MAIMGPAALYTAEAGDRIDLYSPASKAAAASLLFST